MTEFSVSEDRNSIGKILLWAVLLALALFALGVLVIVPLPWKEQGILGATLMAMALLLNWSSQAATATMALMTISVFSTLRYAYWRVIQTWDGITSAGHLRQWDTFFVLLLLAAEFYAFATLVLGYFQTLRPLNAYLWLGAAIGLGFSAMVLAIVARVSATGHPDSAPA